MCQHERIFSLLEPVCDSVEPVSRSRHAAAVVYKRKVIAYGINRLKTHPFHQQFSKNDQSIFLHAETDAIKNALKKIDQETLKRCTLYVMRLDLNDKVALSKPCEGCQKAIATFDIKNVVYSLDGDGFEVL